MKRPALFVLATCLAAVQVYAAPPGTIDGQNIPSDYAASRRVGVQTNYTGAGDVTQLEMVPVFTEGSELDALYLAKDSNYLYVGIAGNLLSVGSPFVIFIDNPDPFDVGQTELRTEGVGGPAFMVQIAGRQVVVDDHGTPNDGSDDTYTVVTNSGTRLPNCGLPGFTGWDYALAIDAADDANMYAHEYQLFGFQIGNASPSDQCQFGDARGRVSCDPTPDNPNDSPLPIYALRNLVASTPLNDGNQTFEGGQPAFGYQRGGFNNTNTGGVTETIATGAGSVTHGVEIAIPLANIGSGLFGSETIHMLVVTMDGDEYQTTSVSDGYGTFLNQALPPLTGGSCSTPASLGMRPNLSVVASCLTVNLSTLSVIDPAAILDGTIVPTDYSGDAPIVTQSCPTSGGDQVQLDNLEIPVEDGSELDAMYVDHDSQYVYLGLTGNLQAGGESLNVFIDTDGKSGGGDAVLSDFSSFAFTDTYEAWDTATLTQGAGVFTVVSTDFGGGYYDLNPNINAPGAVNLNVNVTVNPGNQTNSFRIVLVDEDITERAYDFSVAGPGSYALSIPISNYSEESSVGSVPGLDLTNISFFHITGGFDNGNPGVAFNMTFDHLSLSDNDNGHHVLNFQPGPGAFTSNVINNFSNFNMTGRYASWGSATITSGPSDYRIQAVGGFGGGFYDINPNVDLTGATSVQLDMTVNPASSAGGILVVLSDNDGTEYRWSWFGLMPGNTYALSAPITSGGLASAGAVPGLDLSNISYFHLQGDFATTDITIDRLAVTSALAGVAPILTMAGDQFANGPLDVLNNGLFPNDLAVGYDYAYGVNLKYAPAIASVNYFDLTSDSFAFRGAADLNSGSGSLSDGPGGQTAVNPNGLQLAFDNTNIAGVTDCDSSLPCFNDSASMVATAALTASKGVEMAIPLADIGLTAGDLPRVIQVWTMVGGPLGSASNQSLPSMRNQSYEGNQVINPGDAPVNFTDPTSGPSSGAMISSFSNFVPTGVYGNWTPANFTSGANNFRVQSTDWGGCYYFINPPINASGATEIKLDVTLNSGNLTDRLIVVLVDGDGTTRVYSFDNLVGGTHTLTRDLATFASEDNPGSVPGLDLSTLVQFNVAGAFHHGNPGVPLNVTFDNLELVGGFSNFEARAARVCLGTLLGDGDCDGDNDLIDIALLQQCFGSGSELLLPMECDEMDVVKDHSLDGLDFDVFEGLIDGPAQP